MEMEQREFRADPLKMKRLRVAAGLTVKEFTALADLDRATVAKILRGDPVFLKSLAIAAERVFNITNPLEVLHPDELAAMGVQTDLPSPSDVLEWTIEEYLTGWEKTSNGLQYQLVRLRHRFLEDRQARGKCYELRHLTSAERERLETYLRRHTDVCEQIRAHPNIAQNMTAAFVNGLWWVLDRWEEGSTLDERLEDGPLSGYELQFVMTGIAKGIAQLHRMKIIRRELSPKSVVLRERDDRAILTDMELAKLTGGAPTVSPEEWPDDPYRALEVGGETPVDERADIYSWGRIFVRAATGALCDRGEEDVSELDVPDPVKDLIGQCVAVTRSQRPADMKAVLKVLKGWI